MDVSIKGIGIGGANPPRLMGVLNISPESFFSDSFTPYELVTTRVVLIARALLRAGADIRLLAGYVRALTACRSDRRRGGRADRDLECRFPLDTMYPEVRSETSRKLFESPSSMVAASTYSF